jgi:hypothetical protein
MTIEIKRVEKNGTKLVAEAIVDGTPGTITVYSNGSVSFSPAHLSGNICSAVDETKAEPKFGLTRNTLPGLFRTICEKLEE